MYNRSHDMHAAVLLFLFFLNKLLTFLTFFGRIHTCETKTIDMLPWLSW